MLYSPQLSSCKFVSPGRQWQKGIQKCLCPVQSHKGQSLDSTPGLVKLLKQITENMYRFKFKVEQSWSQPLKKVAVLERDIDVTCFLHPAEVQVLHPKCLPSSRSCRKLWRSMVPLYAIDFLIPPSSACATPSFANVRAHFFRYNFSTRSIWARSDKVPIRKLRGNFEDNFWRNISRLEKTGLRARWWHPWKILLPLSSVGSIAWCPEMNLIYIPLV